MKKLIYFLFLISIVSFVLSCDKNDGAYYPVPSEFSVSPSGDQSFAVDGGSITLTITTPNLGWWIESSEGWCTVSKKYGSGDGEVTVTVSKNNSGISREATLSVNPTFGKESVILIIRQQ